MSRNKGKRGEREIVNMLQPIVDDECRRAHVDTIRLGRNLMQAERGGCDLHGLDWLSLEVKRQETLNVTTWWAQTTRQAYEHQTPVLLYRGNRTQWRCRMRVPVVVEVTGGTGEDWITADVDVTLALFLEYFRRRLRLELSVSGTGSGKDESTRLYSTASRKFGKREALRKAAQAAAAGGVRAIVELERADSTVQNRFSVGERAQQLRDAGYMTELDGDALLPDTAYRVRHVKPPWEV